MTEVLRHGSALVTGVTDRNGIGFAIASALVEEGVSTAITAPPGLLDAAEEAADRLSGPNRVVLPVEADVSDEAAMKACVERVENELGWVARLFNNAGVGAGRPTFLDNDGPAWGQALGVNLQGVIFSCKAALPGMVARRSGSIINIASLAGLGANPGMPYPYTVSKTAVVSLSKQLALEFAGAGIRVNAVCPGVVATSMLKLAHDSLAEAHGISSEEAAQLENSQIPLGRPATPKEIADVAVFVAGPHATYLTGAAIPVAGGMVAGL